MENLKVNIARLNQRSSLDPLIESTTYLFEAKTKAESEIKDLKSENQKLKSIIEQHKNEKVNIKFKYYKF